MTAQTDPVRARDWAIQPDWSLAAYERFLAIQTNETGVLGKYESVHHLCGYPTARFKPAQGGRTWVGSCSACGWRAFAASPRFFAAPSVLLSMDRGADELRDTLAMLDRLAAGFDPRWDVVGVKHREQLRSPAACLSCGTMTAVVRIDRNSLPYISSSCCGTKQFIRSPGALRCHLGWSMWLRSAPNAAAAWMDCWRGGSALWRGWHERKLSVETVDTNEASAAIQGAL